MHTTQPLRKSPHITQKTHKIATCYKKPQNITIYYHDAQEITTYYPNHQEITTYYDMLFKPLGDRHILPKTSDDHNIFKKKQPQKITTFCPNIKSSANITYEPKSMTNTT